MPIYFFFSVQQQWICLFVYTLYCTMYTHINRDNFYESEEEEASEE